ncbi:hypothetical protein LMG29739_01648 [Paraburkholderia solisilvae]|uniref:Uncharacterized protein n=1 Tax=Paraburkholderia solisilvae TaxID=624376 RepID=A0A6J5DJ19_9BURK|nr:hypothetical protein LMG29739_01648 [Paraburkholderia solisilvae]
MAGFWLDAGVIVVAGVGAAFAIALAAIVVMDSIDARRERGTRGGDGFWS